MKFAGQIRFPDLDHPGVPVTFLVEDNQAELLLNGETLGRWSLFDVHARRLVASAFQVDLHGREVTFVADKPMDFAYRGVEHMAQVWARYKAMNFARRMVAVKWSRRGTIQSRIGELEGVMQENLERESATPERVAGQATPEPSPVAGIAAVEIAAAEIVTAEAAPLIDHETAEAHRLEEETLEAQRVALEEERARLEDDRKRLKEEREAAEREVAGSIAAAREEIDLLETERAELSRIESEHAERERLGERQDEQRRLETEALEAKRLELAALEGQLAETERLEAEKLEAQRSEAERLEAERLEVERLDAETLETERLEAEKLEAERAAAEALPDMVKERLGTSAEASSDDEGRDLVVDLGEFEVPPTETPPVEDQPEPVLAGAGQKSGLMGAVRAAFTRSGGRNHVHDFVEAPAGIGIVRSICSECGFVSISTSD